MNCHRNIAMQLAEVAPRINILRQATTWTKKLRIAQQYLSCALIRGRGIVFRYYYQSMAKSAEKDFRDGAVVPFE